LELFFFFELNFSELINDMILKIGLFSERREHENRVRDKSMRKDIYSSRKKTFGDYEREANNENING
jgi:hypothetical protein